MKPFELQEEFEIDKDEPIFTSGVVCRLLAIPVWVLKQLDAEEIVCPCRRDGNARLYSKNELNKLNRIWYLMRVRKVKINGIRVILEMEAL